MKRVLLPCTLAAATLLSSCGIPYFSCNTAELLDPPDKRVALINGTFPKRAQNFFTPTAYWTLDGRTYTEVTVQYARPNRPILRQSDEGFEALYARPLTAEEMQEDFTIDPAIPARRYLLTTGSEPIPAEEFDFRRATRSQTPPQARSCILERHTFSDIPGTPSTWRSIAQAPLQVLDMGVSLTLNTAWIASGFVLLPVSAIFHPFAYISKGGQQQQPAQHENASTSRAHGTQPVEPESQR